MGQKAFQPIPPESEITEGAPRAAIEAIAQATLDDGHPDLDQPDIGKGDDQEPALQACGDSEPAGFQVPAVRFEIAEHLFDPEPMLIEPNRLAAQGAITDQRPRFIFVGPPISDQFDPAKTLVRDAHPTKGAKLAGLQVTRVEFEGAASAGINPQILVDPLDKVPAQLVAHEGLQGYILELAVADHPDVGARGHPLDDEAQRRLKVAHLE